MKCSNHRKLFYFNIRNNKSQISKYFALFAPGQEGRDGESAYEIWISEGNGGTVQQFLESLKGDKGDDGLSAYQVWKELGNSETEQDFIDSGAVGSPSDWVQTSYNTYGGKHWTQNEDGTVTESSDQSKALRKNYAGRNFHYNRHVDAFYDQQPYPSWTLNTTTYLWEPPVAYPNDGKQNYWDETSKSWKE